MRSTPMPVLMPSLSSPVLLSSPSMPAPTILTTDTGTTISQMLISISSAVTQISSAVAQVFSSVADLTADVSNLKERLTAIDHLLHPSTVQCRRPCSSTHATVSAATAQPTTASLNAPPTATTQKTVRGTQKLLPADELVSPTPRKIANLMSIDTEQFFTTRSKPPLPLFLRNFSKQPRSFHPTGDIMPPHHSWNLLAVRPSSSLPAQAPLSPPTLSPRLPAFPFPPPPFHPFPHSPSTPSSHLPSPLHITLLLAHFPHLITSH